MEKQFFVYVLASKMSGTLYIGMTSNLARRVWEHKEGLIKGFTTRYKVKMLVYYEVYDRAEYAITREKQVKKWERKWKIELIETMNPQWNDLYETLV